MRNDAILIQDHVQQINLHNSIFLSHIANARNTLVNLNCNITNLNYSLDVEEPTAFQTAQNS